MLFVDMLLTSAAVWLLLVPASGEAACADNTEGQCLVLSTQA